LVLNLILSWPTWSTWLISIPYNCNRHFISQSGQLILCPIHININIFKIFLVMIVVYFFCDSLQSTKKLWSNISHFFKSKDKFSKRCPIAWLVHQMHILCKFYFVIENNCTCPWHVCYLVSFYVCTVQYLQKGARSYAKSCTINKPLSYNSWEFSCKRPNNLDALKAAASWVEPLLEQRKELHGNLFGLSYIPCTLIM